MPGPVVGAAHPMIYNKTDVCIHEACISVKR